jgi:hypothetical protein
MMMMMVMMMMMMMMMMAIMNGADRSHPQYRRHVRGDKIGQKVR